jgi:hypothetical protein
MVAVAGVKKKQEKVRRWKKMGERMYHSNEGKNQKRQKVMHQAM